jgi:hypothetical protein
VADGQRVPTCQALSPNARAKSRGDESKRNDSFNYTYSSSTFCQLPSEAIYLFNRFRMMAGATRGDVRKRLSDTV